MPWAASVRSDSASPAVLAVREPREAALDEQLLARLLLELAPERPGATGHRRVVDVGAVGAAVKPCLAAGAGARVTGLELIDERHPLARPREPPCQGDAERPRSHDHNVDETDDRRRSVPVRRPGLTLPASP